MPLEQTKTCNKDNMATEPAAGVGCSLKTGSNYVSNLTDDAESQSGVSHRANGTLQTGAGDRFNENKDTATANEEEALDPIQLPQSTHSLLFSETMWSIPWCFAVSIFGLSVTCLSLALMNNAASSGVPANVGNDVRVAQYVSILVALLMEEEIPTGLYLLRMIPRKSLYQKFPMMRYRKFVLSSCARIFLGYYFLINVIFSVRKAAEVLDMFYDLLALEFVQQLDDIAFRLAKMDVFGKMIQRACTAKCFRAEFERRRLGRSRRLSIFLKAIYFLNLCAMFVVMGIVTARQIRGYYQQSSITVDFGNVVWERAWVRVPSRLPSSGQYEERSLVYSQFNGVYRKQRETHDGRPVYKETRKFDRTPFERTVPAEIRYCSKLSSWVFVHEDISKNKSAKETDCLNWLLRSPETTEYDLLNVGDNWKAWVGVIGKAEVSITTNLCNDEIDCNLNGQCIDGKCNCNYEDGVKHLGSHCEVALRDVCNTITSETGNDIWSVSYLTGGELFQEYSRPVYDYVGDLPSMDNPTGLALSMIYSGDRWFGIFLEWGNSTDEEKLHSAKEYHAFWDKMYSTNTFWVSDPTTGSTPVGADFYLIGERGDQYGPFGALSPLQKYNQTGRGLYRCSDSYANTAASNRNLRVPYWG